MTLLRKRQFKSLECLRFLASVTIVLFHYSWYVDRRDICKGFLAVDLFFVLSGFVISFAYSSRMNCVRDYSQFIQKRFARLYPLHALTLLIYVIVALSAFLGATTVPSPEKYRFSQLLFKVTLTDAWGFASGYSFNGPSWSISAELAAYLIFPVILYLVHRNFVTGTTLVVFIYIVTLSISHLLLHSTLPELSWHFGALRAIPSFTLGVWLYVNLELLSSLFIDRWVVILFYVSAVWCAASIALSWNNYSGLAAASAVVIFAAIADHRGLAERVSLPWLSRRGDLTYSIYMIHPVMETIIITAIGPRVFGRSHLGIVSAAVVAAIATYFFATLSYQYFERPAQRLWMGRDKRANVASTV